MSPEISVIVATFNAETHITLCIRNLISILSATQETFEIVVINDGSTDETRLKLESLESEASNLKVFELSRNSGQQIAFTAGVEAAAGNFLVLMDDDMEISPDDLSRVVSPVMLGKCDIAIATAKPTGLFRRLSSMIFWKIMNRISDGAVAYRELTLRCFTREVAENYLLYRERSRSITEIMLDLGYTRRYVENMNLKYYMTRSRHNFHSRLKLFLQILTTSRKNSGLGLIYLSVFSLIVFPSAVLLAYVFGMINFQSRVAIVLAAISWLSTSLVIMLFGMTIFTISIVMKETQQRPLYHLKKKVKEK